MASLTFTDATRDCASAPLERGAKVFIRARLSKYGKGGIGHEFEAVAFSGQDIPDYSLSLPVFLANFGPQAFKSTDILFNQIWTKRRFPITGITTNIEDAKDQDDKLVYVQFSVFYPFVDKKKDNLKLFIRKENEKLLEPISNYRQVFIELLVSPYSRQEFHLLEIIDFIAPKSSGFIPPSEAPQIFPFTFTFPKKLPQLSRNPASQQYEISERNEYSGSIGSDNQNERNQQIVAQNPSNNQNQNQNVLRSIPHFTSLSGSIVQNQQIQPFQPQPSIFAPQIQNQTQQQNIGKQTKTTETYQNTQQTKQHASTQNISSFQTSLQTNQSHVTNKNSSGPLQSLFSQQQTTSNNSLAPINTEKPQSESQTSNTNQTSNQTDQTTSSSSSSSQQQQLNNINAETNSDTEPSVNDLEILGYLCKQSSKLMKNPVRVNGVGPAFERERIVQFINETQMHPINYEPLQEDSLQPDNELREKIEELVRKFPNLRRLQ